MPNRGFTLIELLVVIAIIGVLSSVVVASLNVARVKSRDAQRRTELTQLQTALETYYIDHGSYPLGPALGVYSEGACGNTGITNWDSTHSAYTGSNAYIPNLAPQYIGVLPGDPLPQSSNGRCFTYGSLGSGYILWDHSGDEEWSSGSTGINDNFVRIINNLGSCTATENTFEAFGGTSARCN
jgi:prepilin-type N-terminal cleavage/methylation domain-containing protein